MKLILLIFILTPLLSWSQGVISEIRSPREVIADIFELENESETERIIIISKQEDRVVAFGRIKKLDRKFTPHTALIEIEELIDNSLVMKGDAVRGLKFDLLEEKKVPGFFSLTMRNEKKMPAQYKDLAYLGVFTSEGHTLSKGEWLVGLFEIQHGLTDDFGAKMVNSLMLDGYANLGLKYQVLRTHYAKISFSSLGAYKVQDRDWIWQAGGLLTLPSNSKFQTHLSANFTFDPQYSKAKATKDLNLFRDSDIRNIYEYISDSWNRVLLGPTYNVQLQTFGATMSYMWIWDTFHMSLGFATRDFTNLEIGKEGYYYVYDFFWRF